MDSPVAAALIFGDNRHVADQPYNVLSGAGINADNPRFPESLANMNKFSDKIRSWCDETDPVCAATGPGPFIVENHRELLSRGQTCFRQRASLGRLPEHRSRVDKEITLVHLTSLFSSIRAFSEQG
jgi:hypothetical protein